VTRYVDSGDLGALRRFTVETREDALSRDAVLALAGPLAALIPSYRGASSRRRS
jgi:hypothetical protein